ncbi:hypothetical protein LPJ63_002672 [Coemansia sp. RSA 2711]|nr:hypothetical protein LPJ63_002672 [Coemansia sp. RSA 2711]KAJ2303140.1 hypothetical protein IWW54_005820 [Coemansia sp. RSA 2705]KAJ2316144.1 hypothetical protein IWW52_003792 [Coemansia sp. RSA 2704]KAJ2393207.1 hypothetical protein H4S02_000358 [Coemansia sp. RSA 2611]KAJ2728157.1 hypothetical protein H4R23_003697 [Coemansia sp. Cherry 401B]
MRVVLVALAALAASASAHQHVFASGPLAHHQAADARTSSEFQPGSLYAGQRLIKVGEHVSARWMSIDAIMTLRQAGVGFMDITDTQDLHAPSSSLAAYESRLPSQLTQGAAVNKTLELVSSDLYGLVLEPFTAFHNRYYDSDNGRKSSEWLQQQVQLLADDAAVNVTVSQVQHRFKQPSVVARIEGQTDETVVISAHQDSVNMWLPWFGRASGADDDGSGTVTILEALRVLLARDFAPRHAVEFHWYAGEEGGLLGSQDIAKQYRDAQRKVKANMHFDMTGFWLRDSPEVIGLVADRTDAATRSLVTQLAAAYTRLETREFQCGYGCSDHASWNAAGYRSAMAFESDKLEANTHIHTPEDKVATLDFNHMLEFTKLAVGFAYEVGNSKE